MSDRWEYVGIEDGTPVYRVPATATWVPSSEPGVIATRKPGRFEAVAHADVDGTVGLTDPEPTGSTLRFRGCSCGGFRTTRITPAPDPAELFTNRPDLLGVASPGARLAAAIRESA